MPPTTATDALADELARIAITWAKFHPGGFPGVIAIIKKAPCLDSARYDTTAGQETRKNS